METLGSRIQHLRRLHKLTLDQLGAICGVSAQAVSQWENSSTANIKLEPFLKLCAYFRIDPYVLVFPDDKTRPAPPTGLQSSRFRKLTSS